MESVDYHRFKNISLFFFYFLVVGWDWVHLVRLSLIGLFYPYQTIDVQCWAVGGMRICSENRSTRTKPAPEPLCPRNLSWARTRAAAVEIRQLTALLRHGLISPLQHVLSPLSSGNIFILCSATIQFLKRWGISWPVELLWTFRKIDAMYT
jgi:hypothetical protein